jgi:hypothetical protein
MKLKQGPAIEGSARYGPRRFHIEVTDEGATRDVLAFVRRTFKNWRRIGKLTFDNAVASYNGDHVIHFNHPDWRDDPNDPATANRAPLSRA